MRKKNKLSLHILWATKKIPNKDMKTYFLKINAQP